jgi:hypothetical protein
MIAQASAMSIIALFIAYWIVVVAVYVRRQRLASRRVGPDPNGVVSIRGQIQFTRAFVALLAPPALLLIAIWVIGR